MSEKTLQQWLDEKEMKVAEFAAATSLSDKSIYKYLSGERTPRPKTARRIKDFTGGEITLNSFIPAEARE